MNLYPNQLFHIYNSGNNKGKIFFIEENYYFFLRKLQTHLKPACEILAWCLMPNHFHLQIFIPPTKEAAEVSKAIQVILRSYTRAINIQENRSGSLFQQKTKSEQLREEILASDYAEKCFHYIHMNPFKANLVNKLEDWRFSSFTDYLGLRNGTLVNKIKAQELLDIDFDPKVLLLNSYG